MAPISAPARPAPRLPVLVLFHANHEQAAGADAPADIHQEAAHQLGQQTGKPNSLDFVQVAYRTQSIVITFNYRIGLLGKCVRPTGRQAGKRTSRSANFTWQARVERRTASNG